MKYEYKILSGYITEQKLNELGQDGWEFICVNGVTAFLKRPLQETRQVLNENEYVSS